ncbi:hypothetical protein HB779_10765 [Phyllobacterium sp. 628]|uniref:hypothetical protein n=1 Tax=Phyllobacterium sp. 628 TaxID=2718938 RepID=UPI0016625269|nr:hypothetical protein [Phyllobacterium sp. 628]QND50697.1 hypothetical protein HB779_10765 [Phyllobacterium sp. 628]
MARDLQGAMDAVEAGNSLVAWRDYASEAKRRQGGGVQVSGGRTCSRWTICDRAGAFRRTAA